jgi:hypothetical protein
MRVVVDTECNSLVSPDHIWVIVCKDFDSGVVTTFRKVTEDGDEKQRFLDFAKQVDTWIGHNWLDYDYPQLKRLLGLDIPDIAERSIDTLIVSKLVNYSAPHGTHNGVRPNRQAGDNSQGDTSTDVDLEGAPWRSPKGHSIESYGEEFGLEKLEFFKFDHPHLHNTTTELFKQLETYCARDVEICSRIYSKYLPIISDPKWRDSILLEHKFQLVVNDLRSNGFCFNSTKAGKLLDGVVKELAELDGKILEAFPPKEVLIREFTPKLTKFGTISRTSVPRSLWANIADYSANQTYQHTRLEPFNPASHKQVIAVLNEANWRPVDKTQTHIDTEREL